jgi:hypothetical protein
LSKDVAAALAGRGLPRYLAPVLTQAPIQASATGYYHDVASPTPNREQVVVQVNAHGPLTAWKLPLSDLQATVAYDSGQLVITVDEAAFAGGKISSKPTPWASFRGNRPQRAWVNMRPGDPQLYLDIEILQAHRQAFFNALAQLGSAPKAIPGTNGKQTDDLDDDPESDPPQPDTSSMDVRFVGSMTLPKLATLDGDGHFLLRDSSLPRLHIFGGLSRVLDTLGLGITSFLLQETESDFRFRNNLIYFPNFKISGPDSRIDGVGSYNLDGGALDFHAALTVEVGQDIPVIKEMLGIINRLPRLTPVNITGTLEAPDWSLNPTPSALLYDTLSDEREKIPPPQW